MAKKVNLYDYLIVSKINEIKEINTIESKIEEDNDNSIILTSNDDPELSLILKENFNSLGSEAKQIINFLIDAPEELLSVLCSEKIKKLSILKIRKLIISSFGKKKSRIIFWEMKKFLQNLR